MFQFIRELSVEAACGIDLCGYDERTGILASDGEVLE